MERTLAEQIMKVFIDSMVYLHYRNLEELDLPTMLCTQGVSIVVPRITLRELDKHKNMHPLSRIRNRARRILRKIERWTAEGKEVRPGVSAEFFPTAPAIDFARHGLNPNWNDDMLIASVLQYKLDHPQEEVALITQDSAPKLTATHLGIKVFQLPEEYKLPEEPDPLEQENRELSRTLARLQNALPQIVVCFAGTEEPEAYAKFVLPSPPEPMEEEIKRTIEELKRKLPKQHPPKPAARDKRKTIQQAIEAHLAGLNYMNVIPVEEYERYNKGVDAFLAEYERFLRETWERRASMLRSIQFQIEIRNVGTTPADDVDVEFDFPDGCHLSTTEDLPDLPKEPRPPRKPMTRIELMTNSIFPLSSLSFSSPSVPDFELPGSFNIERTNSLKVTGHFGRIKHGAKVALPELSLTFDSYESASSFKCNYSIRPANLPDAVTGQLHFVIEKEDDGNN